VSELPALRSIQHYAGDAARRTTMRKPAVARVWQGRTRTSMAETYEKYHYEEGVKKLRATRGNLGVQVFRQTQDWITSFITISYWRSRDEIRAYAGADIDKPHHLPKDPDYLLELPDTVEHFDILVDEWSDETSS
jgi:heme-degrading monooxygenase HmoA